MSLQEDLNSLIARAMGGGGQEAIAKQHARGKKTARERIDLLVDPDSFQEIDLFVTHRANQFGLEKEHPFTDGVITGWGKVDGKTVYIYSQDFTIMGGSLGEAHGLKIAKLMDLAYQNGAPLIAINDSGGARIQEGVDALAAYGEIFYRNMRASGVIPQISLILGPCAGGAVYSPAITDFVFMTHENSYMFITGPEVIKSVTGEEVDFATLGGAKVHTSLSGVAHFSEPNEEQLMAKVRWLLSFIPPNNLTPPDFQETDDPPSRLLEDILEIIPSSPNKPYDIHHVIERLVDGGEFLEVQESFAQNLVVGFARIAGQVVGIVANQPAVLAGVLDIDSSDKGARFIRFCDSFHIPIVTLIDTPGFLPGVDQEHHGIIRHGAKLIFAYAEATVPKVSVILRKAYGGAYIVMSSKHLRGDINFAWPTAEIAVMGPEGAVRIIYRKEISASANPQQLEEELIMQYRAELATPLISASRGYLDAIISPQETRLKVAAALDMLKEKRAPTPVRKHSNLPL
ncbi:MAG TPA: methylmalonyl-CoA carboxyltransferase [Anaerolineaceae bacterium]|nr:methylmalonyl-CoA carboxyltransferase [Anaerolineaceae bacterium]